MPETIKTYMTTRDPTKHLAETDDGEGYIMVYILKDIYYFCNKDWKKAEKVNYEDYAQSFFY